MPPQLTKPFTMNPPGNRCDSIPCPLVYGSQTWGIYSVPAFANEWYARNMYQQGKAFFSQSGL